MKNLFPIKWRLENKRQVKQQAADKNCEQQNMARQRLMQNGDMKGGEKMIKRPELNNILQLAKQRKENASASGDMFKEMLSTAQSANKDLPKQAPASKNDRPASRKETPEAGNKNTNHEANEKPADCKAEASASSATGESNPAELLDETRGNQAISESMMAFAGMVEGNGKASNLMNVAVNPETKIYENTGRTGATETVAINALGLTKQLDNALLFRPQIRQQFSGEEGTKNHGTADLAQELKELTGKNVSVEFAQNLNLAEEDKRAQEGIHNLMDHQGDVHSAKTTTASDMAKETETPMDKLWIKVGDNAELAPKLAQELSERIQIAQTSKQNYEIALNPANLGKIFVKVTMENGITQMEMHFSSKKTMELMSKDIQQLSQIIANNRNTEVVVNMTQKTAPDYLEQEANGQGHAKEQQHKEQQRQSEDFIHKLKETLKQESFAL